MRQQITTITLIIVALISVVCAEANLSISNVICQQQYPWNGKVDIDYEVFGNEKETNIWITGTGYDKLTSKKFSISSLVGEGGNRPTKPGKHHLIWDSSRNASNFRSDRFYIVLNAVNAYRLFYEDFESYEEGTELVGTVDGWRFFETRYAGTSTIVQEGNSMALKLAKKEGQSDNSYDMILTPKIKISTANKGRELTKISFRIKPGSCNDIFALYGITGESANRFFYLNFNGESKTCTSYPGGLSFDNLNDDYNDISFVVDTLNKKIISACVNGMTQTCSISCGADYSDEILIRLSTQYDNLLPSREGSFYDFIQVEIWQRFSEPTIFARDMEIIRIGTNELQTAIYNGGPDAEINYTVSSDATWLTINPTSGVFTDKEDICFCADPETPRGCYEANVTFDGGAHGSKTMKLIWQNGFIYQSHFDDMELGDILPQDERWQSIYGRGRDIETYDIVEGGCGNNSKCLKIDQFGYYGGTHTSMDNTVSLGNNYDLKFSFDFKTEERVTTTYFGSNDNAGGEFTLTDNRGKLHLRSNGSDYDFPIDYPAYVGQWIKLSYTISVRDGRYQITRMQLGDNAVFNLNLTTTSREDSAYPRLRLFCWAGQHMFVDNISCEVNSKELEVSSSLINLGDKGKFTIYNNYPETTINYTISCEADWLTIDPTSGELTTTKEINLSCDTNKPYGAYRTSLIIDCGAYGTKEVRIVWPHYDGIYSTTFEEFELGDIISQADEWTDGYGSFIADENEAIVILGGYDGSEKCLRIHANNYYAPHINFIGTEDHSSTNNFRVSFILKIENLDRPIYFNNIDGLGEFALKAEEGGCKINALNADFATTNICALGEWIPISYTLNTAIDNKKLLEFQFGGCVYKNLDVTITDNRDLYDRFKFFRFFIWGDGTSALMDNFRIEYVPR